MTDKASDDADPSSIGAAAAAAQTVCVMDSNAASEFAKAHVASSIDQASVNVEHPRSSSNTSSLYLPPSGMLSGNNRVEVVAKHQHQQYQQNMYMQQMQYMPPMHIPMATVMPSLSMSPVQQCKQGDHSAFVPMPLPAQANPTS